MSLSILALWFACTPKRPEREPPDPCVDPRVPSEVGLIPVLPTAETAERDYATGVGWGDFDGDGLWDLAFAAGNDMAAGPVSVHFGRERGRIDPVPDWVSEALHFHGHLAVGDIDGDGRDDLAVSRYLGDGGWEEAGGVDVYLGAPGGLRPAWSAGGFYSFSCALGDADGDGDLDLAVAVGEPYHHDPGPSRLYRNEGGAFSQAPAWTSGDAEHALDVAFVDPDLDGDLDLVFARADAPHARYDNAGGVFASLPSWLAPGSGFDGNTLDFGDADGDGAPDLLISENTTVDGAGSVRLYAGPAWDLAWTSPESGEPFSAVSLQDLDGDLDLDPVAGRWWGPIVAWENEGGRIGPEILRTETGSVVEGFAWRDADRDSEVAGCSQGRDLVAIPRNATILDVEPANAAIGDGYVSAPGPLRVRWAAPSRPDLAVSNWDPTLGSYVFLR